MSALDIDTIFNKISSLISSVTDVTNVYTYKVSYADQQRFIAKFQSSDKTKIIGWDMYRVARSTSFEGYNKYRHVHAIILRAFYGVKDVESNVTYKKLRLILENVAQKLENNLTLEGLVQDSEPPSIGEIVEDTITGRLIWMGMITMNIEEGNVFTKSVS